MTVIFEPGKEYLPEFFKEHDVELVCSLPCYSEENVDKQRGKGTFDASIRALQLLNEHGYGQPDTDLIFNLVYNPVGPHLPPPQEKLEQDYKRILAEQFGIVFNHLFCLTQYADHPLRDSSQAARRVRSLSGIVGKPTSMPRLLDQVMCRNLISVGWDGSVYDCDFNQMLDLPTDGRAPASDSTSARWRSSKSQAGRSPSAITATPAPPAPAAVAAARWFSSANENVLWPERIRDALLLIAMMIRTTLWAWRIPCRGCGCTFILFSLWIRISCTSLVSSRIQR